VRKAVAGEMSSGAAGGKSATSGRSLSSVNFDDLELMGDMQVQQAVENALASFSARLSTAQGFLVVRGDSNPLGPEIMALVLHDVSQSLPIAAQTRARWLLDGARSWAKSCSCCTGR